HVEDEGVKKNGPDKLCPSESGDPRDSGGPAFPTGDNHRPTPSTPGLLLGIVVISPLASTVNQAFERTQSPGKDPPFRPVTESPSRHTRAPPTLKPPSYTKPPGPTAARTRCASASATPGSPTMPYTAGPHELCPTPTAPHARSRSTNSPVSPGANTPPCAGANQPPVMRWTSPSAAPNPARSASECRKELHQDEMRHSLDVARVRGRKAGERRRLIVAGQPGLAPRHRDHAAPGIREREPCQERCNPSRVCRPAALQHEPPEGECPRAHARAAPAIHGVRQRRYIGRQTGQLGARARHGERELRARAEARVARNRPMHADVDPQVKPVVPREPARELERPGRVGPLGLELRGGADLEQERRSRNRRADPAEASPQITPQVEHAEMQTGRRLDEHARPLPGAHWVTGCSRGGRGARRT